MDGGEVQALVEVTPGGAAFAEVDGGDVGLPLQLAGQRDAGGVQDLGADRGGGAEHLVPPAAPVVWHLPPAAARVGRAGQELQHRLSGGEAEDDHHTQVAVVREDPVLARDEGQGAADLGRLVAGAGDGERRLALPVQRPHALVQRPGQTHPVEGVSELRDAQAGEALAGPGEVLGAPGRGSRGTSNYRARRTRGRFTVHFRQRRRLDHRVSSAARPLP